MSSSPTATSPGSRTPSPRPPGGRSRPGLAGRGGRPTPSDTPRSLEAQGLPGLKDRGAKAGPPPGEGSAMRVPRVRFTLRRLMIVVAIAGIAIGLEIGGEGRRRRFRERVNIHRIGSTKGWVEQPNLHDPLVRWHL